jgi:hypothetical protein
MIEIINEERLVKVERVFESLRASDTKGLLKVGYNEITTISESVKTEYKEYEANYNEWKDSEIGQTILSIINTRLAEL